MPDESLIDLPPFQARLIHDLLPAAQADRLASAALPLLPWYQARLRLYGRWVWSPRLQCWIGDPSARYRYSGLDLEPEPWPGWLAQVNRVVQSASRTDFNSVLCNWYRTGSDSMGWHSDNEPALGPAPVIASLSLGHPRTFHFRPVGATRTLASLTLPHNSLLIMPSGLQAHYQHQLPKTRKAIGDRFNLTFRSIPAPSSVNG